MKTKEVRELTGEEINTKLRTSRKQLVEMRMQLYSSPGSVKNHEIGVLRRTISRLLTVENERRGNETRGHESNKEAGR